VNPQLGHTAYPSVPLSVDKLHTDLVIAAEQMRLAEDLRATSDRTDDDCDCGDSESVLLRGMTERIAVSMSLSMSLTRSFIPFRSTHRPTIFHSLSQLFYRSSHFCL